MRLRSRWPAVVVTLALSAIAGGMYVRGSVSPREELLSALLQPRLIEARLAGAGFAPYNPATEPRLRPAVARRAASRIEAEARRQPSLGALGDLALLQLALGRSRAAAAVLEQAVASNPHDALLLSDLAAVYISLAGVENRSFDLVRALSTADRAWYADPLRPETLFNRALALEKLGLPEARPAWSAFLAVEKDPGWRNEAEMHLRRLNVPQTVEIWERERLRLESAAVRGQQPTVQAIVTRFPQAARLHAEEVLLARWADEEAAGHQAKAAADLLVLRAIGGAVHRDGDFMVQDAVAALDGALAEASGQRLYHLVEGHRRFGVGLRSYRSGDFRTAIQELARAEQDLRLGGSPFTHWARVYLITCNYFDDRLGPAHDQLEDLLGQGLPPGRYPALEGQIRWILGAIDVLQGRPGEALASYQAARTIYTRLGEMDRLSGIYDQMSVALGLLGRRDEAWLYLQKGLSSLSGLQTPRTIAGLLDEAGIRCLEGGYPDVALYFQNEFLSRALRRRDPEVIAAARLQRARTLQRLGRTPAAEEEITAAWSASKNVQEEKPRLRAQAEILTARSEAHLRSDPASSLRDVTAAIEHFETSGFHLQLPLAYFLRARAWLAQGEAEQADQSFQAGLREIERSRESVRDPQLRIAFQDQAAAFFDEVMAFQAARNDGARAFAISERGRARQLLESFAAVSLSGRSGLPGSEHLFSAGEIRQALPPRTALVKYAVLKDQLLIWGFGPGGESFHRLPIPRRELQRAIGRTRSALRAGGDRRSVRELRDLDRQLIAPVAGILADAREIVLVPDRELHLLAFAALVDPRSGRYLVEGHVITVAPSANVYLRCLERSRQAGSRPPETVVVVGATVFDRARFPSLAPLRHAEDEAKLVAASYPRSRLLLGAEATASRFFAELAQAPEVIHFAGHAVPNPAFSELSLLVFAPEPGKNGSGAVYSHEVQGARLDRTRLAVLSACDTAAFGQDSEGAVGLARPFLAAGVPAVLASLAPVEDEQGREVMIHFHRHLRTGDSPAEALRAAQLEQLATGGEAARPTHWAPFEIIGGAP